MDESVASSGIDRSLLFVWIAGLGADDLDRMAAPELRPLLPTHRLPLVEPADAAADAVLAADPAAALRGLGLAVDQRAYRLRPRGRGDDACLLHLGALDQGPPPVTLLEFLDLERTALRHDRDGSAFAGELQRTGDRLLAACSRLRRGDPTELWLVAGGASLPVRTTFDLAAAVARARLRPDRLRVLPQLARLRFRGHRDLVAARAVLQSPPFAGTGAVRPGPRLGELDFLPHGDVALGHEPLRHRPPRGRERRAIACLPQRPRTTDQLDLGGLLARFCLRAAARRDAVPTTTPAVPAAAAAATGLSAAPAALPLDLAPLLP